MFGLSLPAIVARRPVGFVFQTFNLIATMSAFENVELPMVLLGVLNSKQRKAKVTQLLNDVGLGPASLVIVVGWCLLLLLLCVVVVCFQQGGRGAAQCFCDVFLGILNV